MQEPGPARTTGEPLGLPVGAGASDLPVWEGKISPPRVRSDLVERERVHARLDETLDVAVMLVSAPTGYGKTTAVRSWCLRRSVEHAWVTLDAGDNDPVSMWTCVAMAVERTRPGSCRRALGLLSVSQGDLRSALDALAGALAGPGRPFVLVLDNVHVLTATECLESLEHLVARLPVNAHLVAVSRSDPAVRLGRWRSEGALGELRAAALAFTEDEARELLVDRAGIALSSEDVEAVNRRTEGWPATLHLAALWLRDLEHPASAVDAFAGDHRQVVSYLSSEVLDHLDPSVRTFLARSAVLGRFTAELCDAALERDDSAAVLADLERANLFLIPMDGRGEWFRYHSLFEELLRVELHAADPGAETAIHRRAGAWCEARGHLVDAVEHAAAAGDHRTVARLLVASNPVLLDHGLMLTLWRSIRALPTTTLHEEPLLACMAAVAAAVTRQPAVDRRRYLSLADEIRATGTTRWRPDCDAMVGMVHATLVDRDVGAAAVWGARAAAAADRTAPRLVTPTSSALSVASFYAGDVGAVVNAARRAVEHHHAGVRPPALVVAHAMLSLAESERGRHAEAALEAAEAADIARRTGLSETWPGALVAGASAVVLEQEGRLPEAEREARRCLRLHHGQSLAGEVWAQLVLTRIRCARGRLAEATAGLAEARSLLLDMTDPGRLSTMADGIGFDLSARSEHALSMGAPEALSPSEQAVLLLLQTDLTLRQISDRLFVSLNTVKSHTRTLYRKLGVASRSEAVVRGHALGLLEDESPG